MSSHPSIPVPEQEREVALAAYRSCVGLMKVLRARLGIIKCPFCDCDGNGRGMVHSEAIKPYVPSG